MIMHRTPIAVVGFLIYVFAIPCGGACSRPLRNHDPCKESQEHGLPVQNAEMPIIPYISLTFCQQKPEKCLRVPNFADIRNFYYFQAAVHPPHRPIEGSHGIFMGS